jgi:hypothetical protein
MGWLVHTVPIHCISANKGQFFPDSKRLVFDGSEPGHGSRVYVMDLVMDKSYSQTNFEPATRVASAAPAA